MRTLLRIGSQVGVAARWRRHAVIPFKSWRGLLVAGILATSYNFTDGATFPFSENFEGTLDTNTWKLKAPWGVTTEYAHGGSNSLTDSPGGYYTNSTDKSATLSLPLSGIRPYLDLWHRYALERDADYGLVELSKDEGRSWTRVFAVTGASTASWYNPRIDLGEFAGNAVLIRFRILTDAQNRLDGWYIDEVTVADNRAVASFPFFDDMDSDSSETNWLAAGWQRVDGSAQAVGGKNWRCQANSGPGAAYLNLSQAGTMDLSQSVNPQLAFWCKGGSGTLIIYVSGDGGQKWDYLAAYSPAIWVRKQIDLTAYAGRNRVAVRFAATATSGLIDFQVDDVLVRDLPREVGLQVAPGEDPRHQARLNWQASETPEFASYAIYRSTTPGMGLNAELVSIFTNRNTVSFLDTNLALCNQTYYYRVKVVDTNDLSSAGKDTDYRTAWGQAVDGPPFADGLENGDAYWALDWPWAITAEQAHSGRLALSDSPGGNYANSSDRSATLSLLLQGTRPYLNFWHRYAFERDADYGVVEFSKDEGRSWTRAFTVTGTGGTNWYNPRIDLGEYVGSALLARFRVLTDAQSRFDGWYLDDVEIQDNRSVVAYPLYDGADMEGSETNWLASSWRLVEGSSHGNSGRHWLCHANNRTSATAVSLSQAGTMDLSRAVDPQLSFWRKGSGGALKKQMAQSW